MESDSLDWAIIIILLLLLVAPVAGIFLIIVYLIKKVYNMMNQNIERFCYVSYRNKNTGQVLESGIQLETEIDQIENSLISSGHSIIIRYNSRDLNDLRTWVYKFRAENNVIC